MLIDNNNEIAMSKLLLAICLSMCLIACTDAKDTSYVENMQPSYDFSTADQWLEDFVRDEATFDGASLIVVHKDWGVLYVQSYGTHSTDMVYMLASVSKVPSVSLLMAMDADPDLDFDIDTTVENYLPWMTAYPGVTTADMLSNTSGIPGLLVVFNGGYGAHTCQYAAPGQFANADNLLTCGQTIYETPLAGTIAPGTAFDYGGSQWQLAGAVAETVGGDSWANLFNKYIAEPCSLDVYEFGNMFANTAAWNGFPDSLIGQENPNIEGGAISNLEDVSTLLRMHLNDGKCGDNQVMPPASAQRMRTDVGSALGSREWVGDGRGYGLGWWIPLTEEGVEPSLFQDGGAYGSVTWIDTDRDYAVFVALAEYGNIIAARRGPQRIVPEFTPVMDEIMDAAQLKP
ncbi:MAG: CubicO group peptidase (beta-lactamase class C family) [Halioglobus sp.]